MKMNNENLTMKILLSCQLLNAEKPSETRREEELLASGDLGKQVTSKSFLRLEHLSINCFQLT